MRLIILLGLLISFVAPPIIALGQNVRPEIVVPRRGGKEDFSRICALCHRLDGRGGASEGGYAANLQETELSHAEIMAVIANGRREKGMPPFKGVFSESKINALATYIDTKIKRKK